MTVAHYFTFIRILLIPIFVGLYLHGQALHISEQTLALILLAVAGLGEVSDACDGYLARRLNQVTDLGKILDPMADSLSRLAIYFCFTQAPVGIPLEFPLLMLYRDVSVSTLRTICALKGVALAARSTGKFKAFIQAISAFTILSLLALKADGLIQQATFASLAFWLAAVSSLFSLYSGIDYVWANRHYIKKIL